MVLSLSANALCCTDWQGSSVLTVKWCHMTEWLRCYKRCMRAFHCASCERCNRSSRDCLKWGPILPLLETRPHPPNKVYIRNTVCVCACMCLCAYIYICELLAARTEFGEHHSVELERWIDQLDSELPQLTNFILPVCPTIHHTDTVCVCVCCCCCCVRSLVVGLVQVFTWQEPCAGELSEGQQTQPQFLMCWAI